MPIESHTPFGLHGVGQAATGATASPPQPPSQSQPQPQQQQQGDEVAELKQRVRTGVHAMDPPPPSLHFSLSTTLRAVCTLQVHSLEADLRFACEALDGSDALKRQLLE
jgi:hypothetical protein